MKDNPIFSNIKIPHGNKSTPEEMLADIKAIVDRENLLWLSEKQYKIYGGGYSPATIKKHFKTWDEALKKIGLNKANKRYKKHACCKSKDDLLADVKATAQKLNKSTITCSEYDKYGLYGRSCAYNLICGWKNVLKQADLEITPYKTEGYTKEQLLEAICNAWVRLKRQPNSGDVKRGKVGPSIMHI